MNGLAQATLDCGENEIAKYINGAWACESDNGLTLEEDPTTNALAKADLACDDGQVAKIITTNNDGGITSQWACSEDIDTVLSSDEVNAIVASVGCHAQPVAENCATTERAGRIDRGYRYRSSTGAKCRNQPVDQR